jgi:ATP-binding cassette, subfamily C (CFTR/MRP), member 1
MKSRGKLDVELQNNASNLGFVSRIKNLLSPTRFVEMGPDKDISPYESANFISRIYFFWATPLIHKASTGVISNEDLWPLRSVETSESAGAALSSNWQEEQILATRSNRKPELKRAVWQHVRNDIALSFVCKMGWLLFSTFSNAFLLQRVLSFLETPSLPMWVGVLLAFAFLVSEALRSVCVNQHWLIAVLAGVRTRAAIRAMVYDKALRVRDASVDAGRTVNLATSDAQRITDAISYGEFLLSTPVTLAVTLAIIWMQLGAAALAGFAVLLLAVPLQTRIGAWVGTIRRSTVAITDERVRLMAELLAGVRLVKFFGWERAFADRVAAVRAREVAQLAAAMRARVANAAAAASVPTLVTLAAFTAHTLLSRRPLTAAQAFVTVAIFNVARFPLSILPLASKNVSEAIVACSRIQAFLTLPEIGPDDLPGPLEDEPDSAAATTSTTTTTTGAAAGMGAVVLRVSRASYTWHFADAVQPAPAPPAGSPRRPLGGSLSALSLMSLVRLNSRADMDVAMTASALANGGGGGGGGGGGDSSAGLSEV